MRDRLTYIGGACTIVGLLCLLAARARPHDVWIATAAEILIALGVVLLLARIWKHGLS